MIDNEIIQALERCDSYSMSCRACPYVGIPARYCEKYLLHDALSLIKRQQAVIERLQNAMQDSKGFEIDQFNKWIPVTERLPEPKENPVLVVYDGCVWAAWKHDNYWELVPGLNTTCVTHWMPMPQPPKGE